MEVEVKREKKTLLDCLAQVPDPRINRRLKHELKDVLIIGVLGVIANCNDFEEIEAWALMKEDFLKKFLKLPNGIPSHDTINRVFSIIDPQAFFGSFTEWIKGMNVVIAGKSISIDGKALRGSKSTKFGKRSSLHLVNAWVSEMQITLGQLRTQEKSNEITAIPELLDLLMIEGSVITIDAAGCQKNIAELIIKKKRIMCWPLKKIMVISMKK